jgi:hypothetical protein
MVGNGKVGDGSTGLVYNVSADGVCHLLLSGGGRADLTHMYNSPVLRGVRTFVFSHKRVTARVRLLVPVMYAKNDCQTQMIRNPKARLEK